MVSVGTSTIIENVFETFYDLMNTNVISVTIDDKGLANAKTVTVQKWTSDLNPILLDSKSNYPIGVVNSPILNKGEITTYGKNSYGGTIDIEIFTTNSPSADKFLSKILAAVEQNMDDLYGDGFQLVELSDTDRDNFQRGDKAFNSYYRRARFFFRYTYTRTQYG